MAASPLCLRCNYSLHALPTNICPECGQPFDLSNPGTFNSGRPLGQLSRLLPKPLGWPTLLLSAAALAAILCSTNPRALMLHPSLVDVKPLFLNNPIRIYRNSTRADQFQALGTWALAVVSIWLITRISLRALVVIARRQFKHHKPWPGFIGSLALLFASAAATLLLLGWPYRMARRWFHVSVTPLGAVTFGRPTGLSPDQELLTIQAAMCHLPDAVDRGKALQALVQNYPDQSLPILIAAAWRETDRNLLLMELYCAGLQKDISAGPLMDKYLSHPDAEVRITCANALAWIHGKASESEYWINPADPPNTTKAPVITLPEMGKLAVKHLPPYKGFGTPPPWSPGRCSREIYPDERGLFEPPLSAELPIHSRNLLRNMLVNAANDNERESAALALLPWQDDCHFRVSEAGLLRLLPPGPIHGQMASTLRNDTLVTSPWAPLRYRSTGIRIDTAQALVLRIGASLLMGTPSDPASDISDRVDMVPELPSDWEYGQALWHAINDTPMPGPDHGLIHAMAYWGNVAIAPDQRSWIVEDRQYDLDWKLARFETRPSGRPLVGRFHRTFTPPLPPNTVTPGPQPPLFPYSGYMQINFQDHPLPDLIPRLTCAQIALGNGFLVQDATGPNAWPSQFHLAVFNRRPILTSFTPDPSTGTLIPHRHAGPEALAFFRQTLLDRGLLPSEADAFLAQFQHELFQTEGARILTFLSSPNVDALFPLRIYPAPTQLVRVVVLVTD